MLFRNVETAIFHCENRTLSVLRRSGITFKPVPMLSSGSCNAWLEAIDGARVPLRGNCSLGRSSKNTVFVASDRASRQHATIHAQDGGEFWVIDLGSVNGTFLNGRRVQQPTQLRRGDRLSIADSVWVFHKEEPNDLGDGAEEDMETMATLPEIRTQPLWLLLADIEDFTPLSQRIDPESLSIMVGGWVRASREAIEQNGGAMNKYLGDGYLAFWEDGHGVPDRVAAALAALGEMQRSGEPVFRVVVHHGRVALGGSATLGEESLMGPEVNYIFRMEKVASALQVHRCFSGSAASRLAQWIPTSEIQGEYELKGFEGTHRFFAG